MPRGDKRHYTAKQERKAEHIAQGYKRRGASEKTAKARAWATVNAIHGGGELKGGSGYGKPEMRTPSKRGGKKSQAARTSAARSRAATKAAATRKTKARRRSTAAKKATAKKK